MKMLVGDGDEVEAWWDFEQVKDAMGTVTLRGGHVLYSGPISENCGQLFGNVTGDETDVFEQWSRGTSPVLLPSPLDAA